MSDIPTAARVRLGYPSSVKTAQELIEAAGLSEEHVLLTPYDLNAPFSALRKGELDVLVVKFAPEEPDLALGRVLSMEARAALVSHAHPLAGRASLSIEELADYDGFACPGAFPEYLWDMLVPSSTPGGREIRRRHRATSIEEMMALVMGENAVHISVASLADMAPPELEVIPIRDLPPVPVRLAWRADADLPAQVATLIEAVEAAYV